MNFPSPEYGGRLALFVSLHCGRPSGVGLAYFAICLLPPSSVDRPGRFSSAARGTFSSLSLDGQFMQCLKKWHENEIHCLTYVGHCCRFLRSNRWMLQSFRCEKEAGCYLAQVTMAKTPFLSPLVFNHSPNRIYRGKKPGNRAVKYTWASPMHSLRIATRQPKRLEKENESGAAHHKKLHFQ